MFDVTPTKMFKDPVHGYINIPVCFVNNIIDTELFQRLRNIDQTGMKALYPNAKHDRFGHSLGVFHLGSKAVDVLLANFSSDIYWQIRSDSNRALFWAKNKLLFLLACLLHDIGHSPFSHSLENIVLGNSGKGSINFKQILIDKINQTENWGEKIEDLGDASAHEEIGAMMVLEPFRDSIKQIYKYLRERKFPQEESKHILYAEHYQDNVVIDFDDLNNDICFIVRMILGLKYQGFEPEKQIRNCFIELLNGDNIDVDKLDYILRDTKMSGISNFDIDIERLLGSVCIVPKTRFVDKQFENEKFPKGTLHLFNNLNSSSNHIHFRGRFSGNLLIKQGAEVSIAKGSTFVSLRGNKEDTMIQYNKGRAVEFGGEAIIYQNGTRIFNKESGRLELPNTPNSVPFKIMMQNATLVSENAFNFRVCGEGEMGLLINGYCDVEIEGECKAEAEISFYEDTFIDGTIHEIEFMGNEIEEKLPTANAYNTFSIGFKKQALSIIANVLEARDYLYLWIYAHHKVIYFANFLIPVIANNLLPVKNRRSFPNWNLDYKNIAYLDDAYVWTVIKNFRNLKEADSERLGKLCEELLSRKYKRSLFKSLAEFDLLFEDFTDEQKVRLKRKMEAAVDKKNLWVIENTNVTGGFFKDEIVEELKQQGRISNVTDIVYVDASYKRKYLNTRETFVVIHGEAISVDKILLTDKRKLDENNNPAYFYLYYNSTTETIEERKREKEDIIKAIREYAKR